MVKNAYIGVDNGKAREIKQAYIGVYSEAEVYDIVYETVTITNGNVADYFEVTNGTYYFTGDTDASEFTSNNQSVNNSSATSTWIAKNNITFTLDYAVSSEKSWDKFTLTANGENVINGISGTVSGSYNGAVKAGQSIEFLYKKDSSGNTGDDCTRISNFVITIETKVSAGMGMRDVARRVKAAYIGVGGIARPVMNLNKDEITYYGKITNLSTGRTRLAATSFGNYALFGGGYTKENVDAYDTSLTYKKATNLSLARDKLAATCVGNYALFGGGRNSMTAQNPVDAYDTSLTRTTPTVLSAARTELVAATIGNYALFAGGTGDDNKGVEFATVDAYDTSLTRTTPTVLSEARGQLAAATVGNYVLFAGGYVTSVVDAYDTSLTHSTPEVLSRYSYNLAAASTLNHALIVGGGGTQTDLANAYDSSLTRFIALPLEISKTYLAGVSLNGKAVFAGGRKQAGGATMDTVEFYSENLTRRSAHPLSGARAELAGATVGNYALFGGGNSYGDYVDAYTV